jgi:hypothetical protein
MSDSIRSETPSELWLPGPQGNLSKSLKTPAAGLNQSKAIL